MANFKIQDVEPDGSCFFRSIYYSAKSVNALKFIIRRFSQFYEDKENIIEVHDEESFVRFMRKALKFIIEREKDDGYIDRLYENLKLLDKEDYKEVIQTSFPDWFVSLFPKLPKTVNVFRKKLAREENVITNWVAEIEVSIVKQIIEKYNRYTLQILNTRPSSKQFETKENVIYLLNKGESHYNAIVIRQDNKASASRDKASASRDKASASRDNVDKKLRSKSTMKKKRSTPKKIVCPDTKILNEKTNRCVLKNSCKGYELRALFYES